MSDAAPGADFAPITARAILLGERIDTTGMERRGPVSTIPLSFEIGQGALAVVFRYGVVVLIGLDEAVHERVLALVRSRVIGPLSAQEEEIARLAPAGGRGERVDPDGVIRIADRSTERLLIVADALAKSAALADNERQVAGVFDTMDPWARSLARKGKGPGGRQAMIRLIGQALLVEQRLSGRLAAGEKPDLLWDRPDLERLYTRLDAEYEIDERAAALNRKLELIGQTARLMTDLIDTERSHRLELAIVILIVTEIVIVLAQMAVGWLR